MSKKAQNDKKSAAPKARVKSHIPAFMRYKAGVNEKAPVWFLDVRGSDFSPREKLWQEKINSRLKRILKTLDSPKFKEPVLIKTHIGEKGCRTRLRPEFCSSTVEHFTSRGFNKIAAGDSTVAYTGERGHHDNRHHSEPYYMLARMHGWSEDRGTPPLSGAPFVILDKPETSLEGGFEFKNEEVLVKPLALRRFKRVYLAGGFAEAGTIVNHVHLTLHAMAQVACSVKGLTMGGSSYRGKLMMHKCYSPEIDPGTCVRCGTCSAKCPEGALRWAGKGYLPDLEPEICVGCGECASVCPAKSISMRTTEISDWLKGADTLPYRMTDYLMAMMEGRWERLVNIVHMYNITRGCDCVEKPQKPIVRDIGFLVSLNPFAADLAATRLLHDEVHKAMKAGSLKLSKKQAAQEKPLKKEVLKLYFDDYHGYGPYRHIEEHYGVVVEPDIKRSKLS